MRATTALIRALLVVATLPLSHRAKAGEAKRPGALDAKLQWRIPEDPTRWWYNACDKPPDRPAVTRESYLALFKQLTQADWDSVQFWFTPDKASIHMLNGMHNNLPLIFYVMYQETGDKVWAERAVQTLKTWYRGFQKHKKCPWILANRFADAVRVWHGLRKAGFVSEQDEATWWKDCELACARLRHTPVTKTTLEYGAMNRSMNVATYLGYTARKYPDYPEAPAYKKYFEAVWGEFWRYRDGDENSSNYNVHSLEIAMAAVELMGKEEEVFRDPGFRQYCERLLLYQSPCGAFLSFGDDQSVLRGMEVVGLFEHLATKLKDGRYRTAAHNLFNFRRDLHWRIGHADRNYHRLGAWKTSLAEALLWSRGDKTPPKPIGNGRCRVLTRRLAVPIPQDQWQRRAQYFRMTDQVVPDKLILASGSPPHGLFATVELCPHQGHGHPSAPTINGMVMFDSAVLGGVNYVHKTPDWHNVLWIEALERVQLPAKPPRVPMPAAFGGGVMETITVPTFLDQGRAAFAQIDVEPYKSLPVRNRRSIWFLKHRFLWVRDEAHYQKPFRSRLGQVWNTRCVAPEAGTHWANTYIDMSVTGGVLFGSRDKPVAQSHPEPNHNWDLLVWFLPKPGYRMTITDRTIQDPYLVSPLRVRYQWEGLPPAGKPVQCDTILMPHQPGPRAKPYADRIKVLVNRAGLVALEINYQMCSYNRRRDERIVLVWNTSGKTVTVGGIETDALQAYVATGTEHKAKKPYTYAWMRQGKVLKHQGKVLFQEGAAADREQVVE